MFFNTTNTSHSLEIDCELHSQSWESLHPVATHPTKLLHRGFGVNATNKVVTENNTYILQVHYSIVTGTLDSEIRLLAPLLIKDTTLRTDDQSLQYVSPQWPRICSR